MKLPTLLYHAWDESRMDALGPSRNGLLSRVLELIPGLVRSGIVAISGPAAAWMNRAGRSWLLR